MTPRRATDNMTDSLRTDTIANAERLICNSVSGGNAYRSDLIVRQLGVVLALAVRITSAHNRIAHILRVCSQFKMRRIYTRRNVARMANFQTFRDWAMFQLIRGAMSKTRTVMQTGFAVAFVVFGSSPKPTRFLLVNFSPKLFINRLAVIKRTFAAAKRASGSFSLARFYRKGLAALSAHLFDSYPMLLTATDQSASGLLIGLKNSITSQTMAWYSGI